MRVSLHVHVCSKRDVSSSMQADSISKPGLCTSDACIASRGNTSKMLSNTHDSGDGLLCTLKARQWASESHDDMCLNESGIPSVCAADCRKVEAVSAERIPVQCVAMRIGSDERKNDVGGASVFATPTAVKCHSKSVSRLPGQIDGGGGTTDGSMTSDALSNAPAPRIAIMRCCIVRRWSAGLRMRTLTKSGMTDVR